MDCSNPDLEGITASLFDLTGTNVNTIFITEGYTVVMTVGGEVRPEFYTL